MSMTLDRKTLQEIRDAAMVQAMGYGEENTLWCGMHGSLAKTADALDAMLARREMEAKQTHFTSETCPKCGINSLRHEFTKKERPAPSNTPCPFCGDETSHCELTCEGYYVKCPICGASTATFKTPAEALAAWRRKPDLPQPKQSAGRARDAVRSEGVAVH
jgi:transcription elongation factor Elf1